MKGEKIKLIQFCDLQTIFKDRFMEIVNFYAAILIGIRIFSLVENDKCEALLRLCRRIYNHHFVLFGYCISHCHCGVS